MTAGHSPRVRQAMWRYATFGAFFGLCFPMGAMAMLIGTGTVAGQATILGTLDAAHAHAPLLYLIDTAPIFLGLFAAFTGVRQDRLASLNASLAHQVATKTESLREALRQAEKTNFLISHMADHDPLTGLLNRRRMHRELAEALARAKRYEEPFAIAFVDLDRFKSINDRHGHDAGDCFLKGFAALLEQAARETDKVGRWGGDEFLILLPHATAPEASQFADRLIDWLDQHHIDLGGIRQPALASIGVAACLGDETDAESLLALADRAMYDAKRLRARTASDAIPA